MKNVLRIVLLMLAWGALTAWAQPIKVGYVNGQRIENESVIAKQFVEQIRKEFEPRERALNDLQKQGAALQNELETAGAKMATAERQSKQKRLTEIGQQFEQARRAYFEEIEARRSEARLNLVSRVDQIIKGIAEKGKYDLILQQAVYGAKDIDITEQVLAELAKQPPAPLR